MPFTFKSGSVRLEYPLRANGGYRCRHCSPRLFSSTEFPAAAALQLISAAKPRRAKSMRD